MKTKKVTRDIIALLLSFPVSLLAQQPFQSEVNYVRVDMYPTSTDKPITDLRREEVELLEDGAPQTIEQFERVSITGPRPQTLRAEPSTLDDMRRALKDPRARVFVLFLDPRHVDLLGSMQARQPLIDALNKLVGGDDLIAVMTPDMSPRGITFTRRTNNIEELLSSHWGKSDWLGTRDATEIAYEGCYNTIGGQGLAEKMIARRREMLVLDAFEGLIDHLRTLREERKAVITISDGWQLFTPDKSLARPLVDPGTGRRTEMPVPPLGRDPITGRPGARDTGSVTITNDGLGFADPAKCETDRLALSELHSEPRLVRIMQGANRANVSFYPIGPKGFSSTYRSRMDAPVRSLDVIAGITDGYAITQPHEMESGIRRIVDDLSSYYLLGYYSSAKPDGRFHNITVRIKRPGVIVRARTGYLAAPASEASRAVVRLTSADSAETRVLTEALATLSTFSRELPLRVRLAASWTAAGSPVIRAVAEVRRSTASGDDWSKGGQADATLLDGSGKPVATASVAIDPVTFVAPITIVSTTRLSADDYRLQVRVKGVSALGSTEVVPFTLDAAPLGTGMMIMRRIGPREVPTADSRFRRTERIVIEMPATLASDISARVLGRTGSVLNVPLTAAIRQDADGSRWRRVELTLAPLAVGDYVLEMMSGTERTLTAFRIVP